jgi:hypothetical protein
MSTIRQAVQALLRLAALSEQSLQRATATWPLGWGDAEKRARQLLLDNLSALQREQYETCGYFEVVGGDTGKRYRIRRGYQMNVEELAEKGQRIHLLCFVPQGHVPVYDVMLAQKIALELFELDALRVARRLPAGDYVLSLEARVVWRDLRF